MSEHREDISMDVVEPLEGTVMEEVADSADVVEELSELLGDVMTFNTRAHGAHWNVKGPDFAAYHTLFEDVYADVRDSIDPMGEQLLKLDVDAPSTLDEFIARRTLNPGPIMSDDPQVLARDLYDLNCGVLESLEDTYDAANDADLPGLASFLADRLDAHKKWAWQLKRSISTATESPVVAPENPPEISEVDEGPDDLTVASNIAYGRGLRIISERDLRSKPELILELRNGSGNIVEQRVADTKIEVRTAPDGTWSLEGLAAVFDSRSQDLGGFVEVIKRGAFKNVLRSQELDVRALFNHNPDYVLGRSINGTLSMEETPRGLKYNVSVADTSYGRDLRVLLERGDLTQSSFAFRMQPGGAGQDWTEDQTSGSLVRTITDFGGLADVSVVTYPAYLSATAGVSRTSDVLSEQDVRASAEEPNEQADDTQRRLEEKKEALAQRERSLRLRERELAQSIK